MDTLLLLELVVSLRGISTNLLFVYDYLKIFYLLFFIILGQCLNFNCMFILVLMLRQCITFLRTRGFSTFLPLDQHIYLHKLTGVLIFLYSVVHTLMHLINFSEFISMSDKIKNERNFFFIGHIFISGTVVQYDPVINAQNFTLTEWLLTSKPGLFGLVGGAANPTGVALMIILFIMFICSQKFVRRGGCFEVFFLIFI